MCGIVGAWGIVDSSVPRRMLNLLSHRGPDASGFFSDNNVWLGHHRLSIQDISNAGNQPMWDSSRRFVLVYNGEVFNAPILRGMLIKRGVVFRSLSDTEVILEGFSVWGNAVWGMLRGIFSCLLYDTVEKKLFVCRDPLGVKPLYVWKKDNVIFFVSEYKALFSHDSPPNVVRKNVVARILSFRYNPTNETLLEGVECVPPGIIFTYSHRSAVVSSSVAVSSRPFWSWDSPLHHVSEETLCKNLELSVREQLLSDVPIALLSSGGLDSAIIGSLAHRAGSNLSSFTVSYDDPSFEDAKFARLLADEWGSEHFEIMLDSESLHSLPETIFVMDDVVADPSSIPQLALAKHIHGKFKVVLSGGGGDELFGGYTHHRLLAFHSFLRNAIVRVPLSFILKRVSPGILGMVSPYAARLGSDGVQSLYLAVKGADNKKFFYRSLVEMSSPEHRSSVLGAFDPKTVLTAHLPEKFSIPEDITKVECQTFLQHDILQQSDKLFMWQGIESRVPLLHLPIVRLGLGMPFSQKASALGTKLLFRKAVKKYLPRSVLNRKKQGFWVPLENFRRDLIARAESIDASSWKGLGIRPDGVKNIIQRWSGSSSSLSNARALYSLVHLGIWHKIFIASENPSRVWKKL
ncbi:asparagine synthase (glutamine-hydrolyzing) [Candidatus Woesearchaeota archaeon]|nr:asparagine synthase (glutamine-hydrolyzing) [Candidatus Woesearchaeota archaeon]